MFLRPQQRGHVVPVQATGKVPESPWLCRLVRVFYLYVFGRSTEEKLALVVPLLECVEKMRRYRIVEVNPLNSFKSHVVSLRIFLRVANAAGDAIRQQIATGDVCFSVEWQSLRTTYGSSPNSLPSPSGTGSTDTTPRRSDRWPAPTAKRRTAGRKPAFHQ